MKTDLSIYDNSWYNPGGIFKRTLWYIADLVFIRNRFITYSGLKIFILRTFGAKIGKNVVIKPGAAIKYPWLLEIDDYTWIGEDVWIDNLALIKIGKHCCLSQGAYIFTGNHNYKKSAFDLMIAPVTLEEGVWIGAKATVCPGVNCASHSILTSGSVTTKNLSAYGIYQGNPAEKIRERKIQE